MTFSCAVLNIRYGTRCLENSVVCSGQEVFFCRSTCV